MKLFAKCLLLMRNSLKVKGRHNIEIDRDARIRGCDIIIKGKNNTLKIASNVSLKGAYIEIIGEGCSLIIGEGCVIGENCYLSARERGTQLTVGSNCMFSRNVNIMTSDGHDILKEGVRINPAKNIVIGDNVWLAENVTILKGVHVENNCVVGINSTLTKSIEEGVVAAGVPAKVLIENVSWQNQLTY